MADREVQQAQQESEGKKEAKSAKEAIIKKLKQKRKAMMESDIEIYQNDRSPIFDREMYNQPEPYGNPKQMNKGGMSSCPYRPDGVRGGGKAIAGMKFKGVR